MKPAFPTTKPLDGWGDPNQGMSLREWYAGQALPSIMNHENKFSICESGKPVQSYEEIAIAAFMMADAMIKESQNQKQ